MRLILKLAALLCLAVSGNVTLAHAQSQQTDIRPFGTRIVGDDITTHFKGLTHIGAYNFSQNGEPRSSYKETHNSDGTIIYTEGNLKADGRWGVFDDILCYHYNNPAMNGGCYRVYRVENCYYFYSNNLPENPKEID